VTSIRRLSSRTVYESRWLKLREDEIERPDGERGVYALVDKEDFQVVLPWDGERVTLVGQERYTLGRFSWELPAGVVAGAAPEDAARTELAEETGLRAGSLVHLGRLDSAVGYSNQGYHVWLATELEQGEAAPEHEEVGMTTRQVTPTELDAMIVAGEMTDSDTIASWTLARLKGAL
jgi:8-oxo-dGTP pyrophosphatase MutT (NUDIX family)